MLIFTYEQQDHVILLAQIRWESYSIGHPNQFMETDEHNNMHMFRLDVSLGWRIAV